MSITIAGYGTGKVGLHDFRIVRYAPGESDQIIGQATIDESDIPSLIEELAWWVPDDRLAPVLRMLLLAIMERERMEEDEIAQQNAQWRDKVDGS